MPTLHPQLILVDSVEPDDESQLILPQDCTAAPTPILVSIPPSFAGLRLDSTLAAIIPELSRNKIINWIKAKQIVVNNLPAKPKDKVAEGDTIVITPDLSIANPDSHPENIPLNIIHEDEHILVLNKPAGLVVHPGNGNWSGTLLNALLYHSPDAQYLPRAGIVHRLDKDTSGLMVVAKTLLAQTKLVEQLQEHSVSRIYHAIVHGQPPRTGSITKNIGRDPKNRIKMAVLEYGGRNATTHYKVLEYFTDFSHIECRLETGRTHQIRVHLKSIGYPLMADPLYGKHKVNYIPELAEAISSLNRQALHALQLSFIHPQTNQLVEFACDLPSDFANVLKVLRDTQNQ